MTLGLIADRLAQDHLSILGGFTTESGELAVEGKTLLLLGPLEPGFWEGFTKSPEWRDKAADPMDRWSVRVISVIAKELGGHALFPFGAPPFHPFYSWALRAGTCWQSPVSFLVHETAGLMVSFRGALILPTRYELPTPSVTPCTTCAKPCLSACPASALTGDGYDVEACHGFLDTNEGVDMLQNGCAVRRSCPVSQSYGRVAQQSAYHMRQFHKGRP